MGANARTYKRQSRRTDSKVMGAYGRDELNDNGERLLFHTTDNKLALLNTFFATLSRGVPYTFQSANSGKGQFRLEYIPTQQVDRRLVRIITMWRPPEERHEPDHNLVAANIRFLGRFAPNRRTNAGWGNRSIDLQRLMGDHGLRADLNKEIISTHPPLPPGKTRSVDDEASMLVEALLSTAARLTPPVKR